MEVTNEINRVKIILKNKEDDRMSLRTLFNKFPREVGFPKRRFINSESELYKLINRHNAKVGCFVSLYNLPQDMEYDGYRIWRKTGKLWYLDCDLDKIWFDFDGKNAVEDTKRLHKFLLKNNIKHLLIFSGRKGFHIYVLTKNYEKLRNPKGTLKLIHEHFESLVNIELDEKVRGEVARLARVPNTKHISGNRYCIPINTNMLNKGWDYLKERAKEQNFEFKFYGEDYFDVTEFDCDPVNYNNGELVELEEIKVNLEKLNMDKVLNKFPDCVREWLQKPYKAKLIHRHWYAIYCSIIQLPVSIADYMAKVSWGNVPDSSGLKTKYKEFVAEKQLKCAYTQIGKYYFPNCSTLKRLGFCKNSEKCKFKDKIYYNGK